MTQSCLKCLKYTMCVVNLLFFICGTVVFGFGVHRMVNSNMSTLLPALDKVNLASVLFITGIVITCVSFLGFLGAMKENRCLLFTFFILLLLLMLAQLTLACVLLVYENKIDDTIESQLKESLGKSQSERNNNSTQKDDWDIIQENLKCCGVNNASDWTSSVPASCCSTAPCHEPTPQYWTKGCYTELKTWFQDNFLTTGISVILLCMIEVLGMCFSMTLFCHISKSGLGYKL